MRHSSSRPGKPGPPAKRRGPRTPLAKAGDRIKTLVAEQIESRAAAVLSFSLMERMEEQQSLLELQNEQLIEAQAELEVSQHRYADLYDLAPVGYLTLDGKGCIREINQTAAELLGWPPAHLMGRPLVPSIAAPDRKAFLKHLWESRRTTRQVITTLRLFARAGGERHVQLASSRREDLGDRPSWCRTVILDITERWEAETVRNQLAAIVESSDDAIITRDLEGIITTWNAGAERIFGYTAAEAMGQPVSFLIPPDAEDDETVLLDRIRRGERIASYETRRRRKDGGIIDISLTISPLLASEGHITGASKIARDITGRKRAEGRFRGLLEAAPDAMIIVDREGRMRLVNAQATRLFGYTLEELIGQSIEMLVPEGFRDRHAGYRAEYALRPHTRPMGRGRELFALRKDRSEFAAEISLSPLETEDGMLVISAVRDITERKRAEQAIRRLNLELETRVAERTAELLAANEELRHQIAMRRRLEEEILEISEREQQRIGQDLHDDLGQQLAGIWCLSRVLETSLAARKSPDAGDASRITGLLKDALALTRALARGLHPVAMEAGGLLAALDDLRQRTVDVFRVSCRCKCPPTVAMDNTTATHLYRIAQEAVTNAVKHGHAQEIEIELSSNSHHTILSVRDNGEGMPRPDSQQTGMGLRIMSYRAAIIGGALDIQTNQTGGGTTVTCTIPTPRSETPTQPSHGQETKNPAVKPARTKSPHRR